MIPRRLRAALGACVVAVVVAGCSADAIVVSSAGLSEEATYVWLTSVSSGAKSDFTTADEKVTMNVRFAPNFVGMYQWFRVEWLAPTGGTYLKGPAATKWGSHQELITELPIYGQPAAKLTGTWKVKLFLEERLMVEESFTLGAATQEQLAQAEERERAKAQALAAAAEAAAAAAAAATPPAAAPAGAIATPAPAGDIVSATTQAAATAVRKPVIAPGQRICPPLDRPAAPCVDEAPEEAGFYVDDAPIAAAPAAATPAPAAETPVASVPTPAPGLAAEPAGGFVEDQAPQE